MPGNHSRLSLTVIAFLILYSEKMQEVNVRSRNSATSWKFWLYRCQKQGHGHQNADAVVDPDRHVSRCVNISFFTTDMLLSDPGLLCVPAGSSGSHETDIILLVFDVSGLSVLRDSCEDEACAQSETAAG